MRSTPPSSELIGISQGHYRIGAKGDPAAYDNELPPQLAYVAAMVLGWGAKGVFIAITLAEVLLAIIAMVWFKKGNWKQVQV